MNILLLEDNPRRIAYFQAKTDSHSLTICRHAKAAKKALRTATFDVIFLDHDLNGKPEDPSSANSGSEVARFIVEREIACEHIILHSENPIGREAMEDILLARAETIPYGKLKSIGLRKILDDIKLT